MSSCSSFGGILSLYIARSCDVLTALSGTTLNISEFERILPLPTATYTEEGVQDDNGTSYVQSIQFSRAGESQELQEFEKPYLNRDCDVLVLANNGYKILFRNLQMTRRAAESGDSVPAFNGRNYTFSGFTTAQAIHITAIV